MREGKDKYRAEVAHRKICKIPDVTHVHHSSFNELNTPVNHFHAELRKQQQYISRETHS